MLLLLVLQLDFRPFRFRFRLRPLSLLLGQLPDIHQSEIKLKIILIALEITSTTTKNNLFKHKRFIFLNCHHDCRVEASRSLQLVVHQGPVRVKRICVLEAVDRIQEMVVLLLTAHEKYPARPIFYHGRPVAQTK